MSVSVTAAFTATVVETLAGNPGSASSGNRVVKHDQYDQAFTLNGSSSPVAAAVAEFVLTLSGGAATIDLTALTGTNGATVNGTGLKPRIVRIKNLGANPMTFAQGASNGYVLGSSLVVDPSGIAQVYTNDGRAAVGSGNKTIDVSGTGAQTAQVTIILG